MLWLPDYIFEHYTFVIDILHNIQRTKKDGISILYMQMIANHAYCGDYTTGDLWGFTPLIHNRNTTSARPEVRGTADGPLFVDLNI